ncbi:methyltransferase, partial [Microbacterium sp. SUBG005]
MTSDFIDANRANWDERATLHAARDGSGYGVQRYVTDPEASDVVRFDAPLL